MGSNVSCDSGTTLSGDGKRCIPDIQQCATADGTRLRAEDRACVANCGDGAHIADGVCKADIRACGQGTQETWRDGGRVCVADIQKCGNGTVRYPDDSTCYADPHDRADLGMYRTQEATGIHDVAPACTIKERSPGEKGLFMDRFDMSGYVEVRGECLVPYDAPKTFATVGEAKAHCKSEHCDGIYRSPDGTFEPRHRRGGPRVVGDACPGNGSTLVRAPVPRIRETFRDTETSIAYDWNCVRRKGIDMANVGKIHHETAEALRHGWFGNKNTKNEVLRASGCEIEEERAAVGCTRADFLLRQLCKGDDECDSMLNKGTLHQKVHNVDDIDRDHMGYIAHFSSKMHHYDRLGRERA